MQTESIAIYMRVSTRKQDVDSQRQAIIQWLEKNSSQSWDDCRVYIDHAMSGAKDDRPGLQELLQAAEKQEFDTLLVYRLDRLSRKANTAIQILLRLDEVGVGFISVTQAVLNLGKKNPFRRTMLAAFSEIAELEREGTILRIHAGLRAARARGVKLGPPRRINQETQELARQLRKEGHDLRHIAQELGISLGSVARICSA